MNIQAIKGTEDRLPQDTPKWNYIETTARDLFRLYNFHEIQTPIIEEEGLFVRSIGDMTDIVGKEMYSFTDRGEKRLALRPEATAAVVRAYLEHYLYKEDSLTKLYYIGPMFRAERPQAGRLRQFHHVGVEAIGSDSPYLDAEIILLLVKFLDRVGIRQYELRLNSLGCDNDKARLQQQLCDKLKDRLNILCKDCRDRYKRNVFRLLDCKNDTCKKVIRELNLTSTHLCKTCQGHFDKVKEILQLLKIPYELDATLVRGLDYYTRTIFEVRHNLLGSQDAVGAGGRYDNLVELMGGPKKSAIGFAVGVERLLVVMEKQKIELPTQGPLDVYIATVGDMAYKAGFELLNCLRDTGISSDTGYLNKSLKSQMRTASGYNAKFVVILGEDELNKGVITLRDMKDSQQREIAMDRFIDYIKDAVTRNA